MIIKKLRECGGGTGTLIASEAGLFFQPSGGLPPCGMARKLLGQARVRCGSGKTPRQIGRQSY